MKQFNLPATQASSLALWAGNVTIIVLVFLLLFVGYFHEVRAFTQDLGRHLLLGRIILETGTVPITNLLSYTNPDFPFLNHHYLSEIVFYLVFQASSIFGLLVFVTILILVAFCIVFFFASKRANIVAIGTVSALLLPVLFERTDIRPEIFSFFFLSIFVTCLYTYRERFTKWIYLLPLLMLLWVNMHVYFFVGIVLLFLFLLDFILIHKKKAFSRKGKILFLVFLASCFITLINPHGIKGALYPLQAFQNYGYTIEENQTIFLLESLGFVKDSVFYFKISVALLFLTLLFSWRKAKPIDWLLAITFSVAGALAVRNLPLFVFSIFIPFAISLSYVIKTMSAFFHSSRKTLFKHIATLGLICLLLWQIVSVGKTNAFGFSIDSGAERGANFFIENKLKGPLFNNFDIGSYLAYRLYPQEKVFVDGRPEAYPAAFFQNIYIPMQEQEIVFEQTDKQYSFNTIFFSHTDQTPWGTSFLQTILQNQNWKTVYLDDIVLILVKQKAENSLLIKQFGMDSQNLKATYDTQNLQSLLRVSSFFSKIGDTRQELRVYEEILGIDRDNCLALYNAGIITAQQQNPLASVYGFRYRQKCL